MLYIIVIIVVVAFVLFHKKENNHEKIGYQPDVEPPTDDVKFDGCQGPVFCGYCTPKIVARSGDLEMIEDVYECAYTNSDIKAGSPCAFAKDHPDKMRKSPFLSMDFK